jgi:hypothetical protein
LTTPTLEDAIAALRLLSPERQEELAGYIYELAVDERAPEVIDPAHLPAVMEGVAQVERGEFAAPEMVSQAFERFRR